MCRENHPSGVMQDMSDSTDPLPFQQGICLATHHIQVCTVCGITCTGLDTVYGM